MKIKMKKSTTHQMSPKHLKTEHRKKTRRGNKEAEKGMQWFDLTDGVTICNDLTWSLLCVFEHLSMRATYVSTCVCGSKCVCTLSRPSWFIKWENQPPCSCPAHSGLLVWLYLRADRTLGGSSFCLHPISQAQDGGRRIHLLYLNSCDVITSLPRLRN